VGAALALGGAFTAHADTTAPDATEAEKAHSTSPVTSTSTGKHAKPYVSGSETPALTSETDVPEDAKPAKPYLPGSETDVPEDAKPAKPYLPGSETDVPKDAKPAQPVQQPATPAH
jgi:hypothetical protein